MFNLIYKKDNHYTLKAEDTLVKDGGSEYLSKNIYIETDLDFEWTDLNDIINNLEKIKLVSDVADKPLTKQQIVAKVENLISEYKIPENEHSIVLNTITDLIQRGRLKC